MDVILPADLRNLVEQELASGRYDSSDELIAQAVRYFLDDRLRGQRRLDALRSVQAVDQIESLPVCKAGGGTRPGVDLNDSATVMDIMEGRTSAR